MNLHKLKKYQKLIFGLICENLSITPAVPKSGEHEDHIPPIAAVLIYAITVSVIFGR